MVSEFNEKERKSTASEAVGERLYTAEGPGVPLLVREVGSGPPLVILHGGPGAHHDYISPYFDQLADRYRLYYYDQRGGGRSRVKRPSQVSWRDHVADLEVLRAEWGMEQLDLIGYSWGGLLALLYSTAHEDHVRLLILVSPAGAWGDYQRRFADELTRRSSSDVIERMREELEASGLADRDRNAYRQRLFELAVAPYFRDPRDADDLAPFRVQTQAQEATWGSLKGIGPQLREWVRELSVPTLILHGRHDPIPLEWAEELAATLPNARLVVLEESGHVPYVEEPERMFTEIRGFLRQHLD